MYYDLQCNTMYNILQFEVSYIHFILLLYNGLQSDCIIIHQTIVQL